MLRLYCGPRRILTRPYRHLDNVPSLDTLCMSTCNARWGSHRPHHGAERSTLLDIVCLAFEGILVPEIWINIAEHTGIEALRATTRDVPDYDALMRQRLRILKEHGLRLPQIRAMIAGMAPLEGAPDFLDWLRQRYQVVLLSDTFYEFATPLLLQLSHPLLLCHHLQVDADGTLTGYSMRQKDSKRMAVQALHSLSYRVIAVGDSYNDTTMLTEADVGLLFRPPANVAAAFPQFPVVGEYDALCRALERVDGAGPSVAASG